MKSVTWTVDADSDGMRLDVYLARTGLVTRSRALSLLKEGRVTVDGRAQEKAGFPLKTGMAVEMVIPQAVPAAAQPEDLPLRVLYQDADLAVIYKPSGLVVHPAAGNPDHTLVNALLYHLTDLSGIGGEMRPGIVHRIDKDTSGLLLVAKNDRSHVFLSEQIKAHTVNRVYMALVQGNLKDDEGRVDAPIGRSPKDRKKMAIVEGGRSAVTFYKVVERFDRACLIEARLTTGRTHQIRVHMASLGHPVLGDPLYGPKRPPYPVEGGQLLHACQIGFVHPTTGEKMLFRADPEPRFWDWLAKLRNG